MSLVKRVKKKAFKGKTRGNYPVLKCLKACINQNSEACDTCYKFNRLVPPSVEEVRK